MGHYIISGNSGKNKCRFVENNQPIYIGDLVGSLYLSCIGPTVCGESGFVSLPPFHISSHII